MALPVKSAYTKVARCWGQPIFRQPVGQRFQQPLPCRPARKHSKWSFPQTVNILNWMEFQAVNGPVAVPTGLSATAGNAQVVLSWSTAAGATSYNVQSSTTEGGPYTTIASPTTTSYTNTGLVNGTTYYYVVSAAAGSIVSSNSVEVGATPVLSHVNLALNQPVTVSSTQSG